MRIAIDARPLTQPLTGVGRYTYNVLLSLLAYKEHEWFIYSDLKIFLELPERSNIHYRHMNRKLPLSSTFFSQLIFPVWAKNDRVDLFWSPGQHLPLFLSSQIRSLITVHDLVWLHYPETMSWQARILDKLLIPKGIKAADHILSVSENTRTELIEDMHITPEKITVTRLAPTPLPATHTPILIKILKNVKYVLFVGTKEPRKNLINLIAAFSKLHAKYSDYKLVICGQAGWRDKDLHKNITHYQLSDYVIMTGYLDEQQLHGLYKYTKVLAMPSLYEGFGLPALEALAYNKPVVVTRKTEISRLISPLIHCCEGYDADSIYEALIVALTSAPQESKLELTWQTTAIQTLNKITSL